MLRVVVELVPRGDENAKRTIGVMEIANDGTSEDYRRGDYRVRFQRRHGKWTPWKEKVVRRFPRLTASVWDLILRVLAATQPNGNARLVDELRKEMLDDDNQS